MRLLYSRIIGWSAFSAVLACACTSQICFKVCVFFFFLCLLKLQLFKYVPVFFFSNLGILAWISLNFLTGKYCKSKYLYSWNILTICTLTTTNRPTQSDLYLLCRRKQCKITIITSNKMAIWNRCSKVKPKWTVFGQHAKCFPTIPNLKHGGGSIMLYSSIKFVELVKTHPKHFQLYL